MYRGSNSLLLALGLAAGSLTAWSQSITTGTLQLRNGQPSTVSLTVPTTGVTPYTLILPTTVGESGQALTIQTVTGTSATLSWSNTNFWSLQGSDITLGGTAAGQQYLGTKNSQDLVIASNGTEAMRIIGVAGPSQGWIGLGTSTPSAPIDLAKTVLLSNTGQATELRFAEPSASGTNYTGFRAAAQTADVVYTLPDQAPTTGGMVLSSTTAGVMSWRSALADVPRGMYVPTAGNHVHTITIGQDVAAGAIPIVTVVNAAGTTIAVSVTSIDTAADTFTVETSTPLAASERIAWMVLSPM
ncbi:MAG: hypothetical protein RIR53_489 [Bacteroidota bacterium]|jgi:hypothetical protein